MPRLSIYSPTKSNNFRYIDRMVKAQFEVGGTDLLIHKYLGPSNTGPSTSLVQPQITKPDPLAIQDLLFLENRDRKYDSDVYRLRGHYNVANLDFDLSQFGLFLTNDIIFVTVHYNDMIDLIGRKLMVGDVFELPHLTDYHPLNEAIPVGLRRYYQITDANYASEGFSQTWYPHLWRIKCEPLVDSQQFAGILSTPTNTDTYMGDWSETKTYGEGYTVTYGGTTYTPVIGKGPVPAGTLPTDTTYWQVDTAGTLKDLISTYNKNIAINDAALAEAARLVPQTGVDRSQLYLVPSGTDNAPAAPINIVTNKDGGPQLGTGTVAMFRSRRYKNAGVGIKVGAAASERLKAGARVVLSTGVTNAGRNAEGSGRVNGDTVLTATVYTGTTKTGPYGTSDNVYSTADQVPNFYITTVDTAARSTVVSLLTWSDDLKVGLTISGTVYSANGTPTSVFDTGTRITGLNKTAKTVTVSSATKVDMIGGVQLEVATDFSGIFKSVLVERTGVGQTKIVLSTYNKDLTVGSVIRANVLTTDGGTTSIFKSGTTVTSIIADIDNDDLTNPLNTITITASSATLAGMNQGDRVEFAFDDGKLIDGTMDFRADEDPRFQFIRRASPRSFGYLAGYGAGDGQAPNGEPTGKGIVFPANPTTGDYFLRTDYSPQTLFRWDGSLWVKISEKVRTATGFGAGSTNQKAGFINNTGTVTLADGSTVPSRQSLSSGLRAD
jgi:hypothetical protein